jgi:PAS domain S-box-containing protein
MVLDIPPVLDEAGITGDPRGLSLALRQASGQVFFGSAEVFKAEPVLYRISLPDGSWELGAVPARGWDASIQDALFLFRGAGLTIVALMAGLVSLVINRQGRLKVAVHQATVELERDIAERKRMEEALRISQARFAGIVEISEDAIISLDDFQRIILFNQGAARTFGYRAEEVLGQPVDLLIPARFVEAHRHHVEKFTSCRDALRPMNERGTIFGLRKDGTEFPAEASIAKFEVAGEKVLTVRLRDITERRRLEAQVRQAQKMEAIGSLAGGIAHDFNNILSAMLGYTEQAMLGVQLESRVWHDLHEVLVAGERARELVRHILTFSRQSEQERRPVHLHHIVAEALKLLRATLPATIEIRQELDPAPGAVLADPTQMHQVVMNLCTNAGHAMRESGGVLEVGVKAFPPGPRSPADHPELGPGPYLKLTVRDSGHGMEREILERIFDPFFTTKEPGEGTGMGLAVVHGIVASHGGVITVQSAPGEGTTFEVYLPQTADSIPAEVRPEEPVAERGARILFVDDEPALARLGAEMLEGAGHRVVATASSLEALKVFRAAPDSFDVVITDQTMPEMTGEALARELLSIRPDLPVIQCTGFSHTLSAEKARAMGIAEYILKPVGRRDLRAAVQRALRAKREQAQRDASGRPKAATPAGIPTEPEEAPGSAA